MNPEDLESRQKCPGCHKPIANEEEWRVIPPGEGDWLCWENGKCLDPQDLEARLWKAQLVADRLRLERDRLRELVKTLAENGRIFDDELCFHEAQRLGLIVPVPGGYDPERHGEDAGDGLYEKGDPYWMLAWQLEEEARGGAA